MKHTSLLATGLDFPFPIDNSAAGLPRGWHLEMLKQDAPLETRFVNSAEIEPNLTHVLNENGQAFHIHLAPRLQRTSLHRHLSGGGAIQPAAGVSSRLVFPFWR